LVDGGKGADSITVIGDYNTVSGGAGLDTIDVIGAGNTVRSGADGSDARIDLSGSFDTFESGANSYHDTIIGFDQAAGDRIQLTTESVSTALAHSHQVNGGHDTLITLQDGSTILLKGVSHINASFFS
jgi:hypothetical protein